MSLPEMSFGDVGQREVDGCTHRVQTAWPYLGSVVEALIGIG